MILKEDVHKIKLKTVGSTDRDPENIKSQRDVDDEKRLKDLGLPKLSKF